MGLHYKARKDETVQYLDVLNLYQYIGKYFKLPVGRSVIHVQDVCKDKEACLRMDAQIKCSIFPPEKLYHPMLPFRTNKKHMLCLFRKWF